MGYKGLRLAGLAGLVLLAAWGCTEPGDEVSPHAEGWADPLTDAFHGIKIRAANFDLTTCHSCHGDDLQGTAEVAGCSSDDCHTTTEDQSPLDAIYACDNCHGFLDSDPFVNVEGQTNTDSVTVGVHTSHYASLHGVTSNVSCSSCHIVPGSALATGHIDETSHAEVTFDTLATAPHAGALEPAWDRSTATCANIYCHGNFTFNAITGNDSLWNWTTPASGQLCGTCHGLPPDGHFAITEGAKCGICHSTVVDPNDNGIIIGLAKHINGQKNVFGN